MKIPDDLDKELTLAWAGVRKPVAWIRYPDSEAAAEYEPFLSTWDPVDLVAADITDPIGIEALGFATPATLHFLLPGLCRVLYSDPAGIFYYMGKLSEDVYQLMDVPQLRAFYFTLDYMTWADDGYAARMISRELEALITEVKRQLALRDASI